ncbi:hypothetical protein A3A95_03720 [Candidatus Nomurabacteria bacterium RIFCSPLOWO2_01_FULL_39_18]|uniref:Uncharacterized protein n=1 Tax=Candidatus Nomurabacteria bacterium RIFCSPHIGHO2_01_FULL_40_24b TaxID=1801739 RepID=A0A1F6V6E1_9BACT|nr:MAG: hypothetical protein A2647_04800 [Candidatus Nomurabacteria bacterium RIFCSPHIGHO2_01_FULL_40_24b]OGI89215.1 MAG: hypothetical protein A3A95_03720 [Candidatus Nomurabacteria bacterium RIFCSPLOWO2_01_FULL_39_18]
MPKATATTKIKRLELLEEGALGIGPLRDSAVTGKIGFGVGAGVIDFGVVGEGVGVGVGTDPPVAGSRGGVAEPPDCAKALNVGGNKINIIKKI